jgi:hypothetical protein
VVEESFYVCGRLHKWWQHEVYVTARKSILILCAREDEAVAVEAAAAAAEGRRRRSYSYSMIINKDPVRGPCQTRLRWRLLIVEHGSSPFTPSLY